MSDLGALLRKAREQRGLSLDDIQELTKIRKRYLEAIEEGNYKVLPGSFYVRAFVKNYSESVGLDAEEVLRLYQKEIPSPVPEQVAEPVQRPRRTQSRSSSDAWSRWGFRALMWSFLLLIVVIVYVYAINRPGGSNVDSANQTKMTDQTQAPQTGNGDTPPTSSNGTGSNQETDKVAPAPVDPTPPAAVQTTLTLERTSGRTDYYKVSPTGTHKIEFKVTGGNSWVGVNQNSSRGKILLSQTLKDNETATVDVEGAVYINIAHANLVEVTVDGVLIDDGNKIGTRKMQLEPSDGSQPNT
ncbi:helix-turn-helix domain-containing protein [Paenibacillus sp. sptzw28]|uniref:helix-turn-helix domain-containing protein n=1 Tax=Paenibacillus sp. sptzw28 TaxID=715179 RepID=UPI001C6DEA59|nr:RodZ family helix-turn-helix domain-containing protein [Paenibacillus sp. sptzw28]QYR19711.1 helix-turn-helix domain-containing protein [Paenibacillus sp. sptzw28]